MAAPTNKPKQVLITPSATEVVIGTPITLDVIVQNKGNDNARNLGVLILAYFRVGPVPHLVEVLNVKATNASGPTDSTATTTFTPTFLGEHTFRVIAWNNKGAEKPDHGTDHRTRVAKVRVKKP